MWTSANLLGEPWFLRLVSTWWYGASHLMRRRSSLDRRGPLLPFGDGTESAALPTDDVVPLGGDLRFDDAEALHCPE
jgi:hypothetical protein